MNPCETSENGVHVRLLAAYLQGVGDRRWKGMHLGGSAPALALPEIYVHACCFQQGTSAQGSGDQQKQVFEGGYVRHGCLMSELLLADSADHQTTCLEGAMALSCSWVKKYDRSSGS